MSRLSKHLRYYQNQLEDYNGSSLSAADSSKLQSSVSGFVQEIQKLSTSSPHPYTGLSGLAYALWRVSSAGGPGKFDYLSAARAAAARALQAVQGSRPSSRCVSLLDGSAGVYLVACLVNHTSSHLLGASNSLEHSCIAQESRDLVSTSLSAYAQILPHALKGGSDEFLYGRAGYLAGQIMLRQHLGAVATAAIPDASVRDVAAAILDSGRQLSSKIEWNLGHTPPPPLMYMWPEHGGSPYLGAAHGLIGILYTLLHCDESWLDSSATADIQATLRYVLSHETDTPGRESKGGHYPVMARVGLHPEPEDDILVHWCHGSPGAVFLFLRAYKVLNEPEYLAAAQRAAELVWERGLLIKGPGLCHGVSGNAYALLAMWRATKDEKWLFRAQQMALFIDSPLAAESRHRPDNPLSLFEGLGGAACLAADLLHPESARFPLFELS